MSSAPSIRLLCTSEVLFSRRKIMAASAATGFLTMLPATIGALVPEADADSFITSAISSLISGTKWLANNVLDTNNLQNMTNWLGSTPKQWNQGTSYHDRWAYPIQFSGQYPLYGTNYGSYFGVDKAPVLTTQNQYESKSDLNWAEIDALKLQKTDPTSVLYTGGPAPKLLPGFTGARRPATPQDAGNLQQMIASDKTLPSGQYGLSYVRDFCTCQGSMRGYAMLANNNPNPDDFKFRLYKA